MKKIDNLSGSIRDIDQQQHAHHVAITRLEHDRNTLPDDRDTVTDAHLKAAKGFLPSPHRLHQVSSTASVLDFRHGDREAPGAHRLLAKGHYVGRGSAPRFYKLNFLVFDSQEDPLPWLNRCDQFFRGQHTMEGDKVWLATFLMTSSAQL